MTTTQEGYLAAPAKGGPAVLVLHAWWGLNPFFKQLCDRLASEGFVALAADLYAGKVANTIDEAKMLMEQCDSAYMQRAVTSAVQALRQHPQNSAGPIGIIGFSMGASWAIELAAQMPADIRAATLFYGVGEGDFNQTQTRFQGHFVAGDEWEEEKWVRYTEDRMKEAGLSPEFFWYEGVKHWFFEDNRPEYNAEAAALAWQRTLKFLREQLRLMGKTDMGAVEDMLKAVKAGDLNAVKALLAENQALVNATDDEGNSAILIATYWGKHEVAEALLAHDPQMSVFEASAAGQLNRVKQLLEEHPVLIHAWSRDGFMPLHLAAFFGRRDVAEFLLARNPDVNAVTRNPIKVTPLHSAAAGNHYEICMALIAHGADVNARQEGGFTPLHSAAQNGSLELVDLLLQHGADPHAKTDAGKTARDFAAEGGHAGVAMRLPQ